MKRLFIVCISILMIGGMTSCYWNDPKYCQVYQDSISFEKYCNSQTPLRPAWWILWDSSAPSALLPDAPGAHWRQIPEASLLQPGSLPSKALQATNIAVPVEITSEPKDGVYVSLNDAEEYGTVITS